MPLDIKNCMPSKGCQEGCLLACTQAAFVMPNCVTESILHDVLGIEDTFAQNSDRLDFHDVHIDSLRKVLQRAYLDGRASVLRAQGVSEDDILAEQSLPDCMPASSGSEDSAQPKLAQQALNSESALHEKQWRNITKVVKALADFCFGSPNDPTYGHCHVALTTSLTAKDGLDVTALKLERLSS